MLLGFAESQSSSSFFKIKICSNYIDPSSGMLSFSSPVWLVCQSIEKHLTIRPNYANDILMSNRKDNINNINLQFNKDKETEDERKFEVSITNKKKVESFTKTKISTRQARGKDKNKSRIQTNYIITFDSIDKNNSLNNIYGLFYVEQCETSIDIKDTNDDNTKRKMQTKKDLKLSTYVQYHKPLRFLHATTRMYLGFKESDTKSSETEINNKNIELQNNIQLSDFNNEKTSGSLILSEKPDENCNWMFMESYKILDAESYFNAKSSGVEFKFRERYADKRNKNNSRDEQTNKSNGKKNSKENEKDENLYKIKNKEILRIFHVKSQKFLCFDEINNKLKKNVKTIKTTNKYSNNDDNAEEKSITVQNLTLSKTPYDCDLIRLVPSNADQSWEIKLVLYFSDVLTSSLMSLKSDLDIFFKNNVITIKTPIKDMGNNSVLDNNNNTFSQNINFVRTGLPGKDKPEDRLKSLRDNTLKLIINPPEC